MTKQGNKRLRWILVQDAWKAMLNHGFFGRLYERNKGRLGKSKAIVPVARALLKTIYKVWTEGKAYEGIYAKKDWVGRARALSEP